MNIIIIIHYYPTQNFGGDVAVIQVNLMLSLTYDYSVNQHNSIRMTKVVVLQMLVI